MAKIDFTVPHALALDEVRARIAAGIPKLREKIPGGAEVEADWQPENRLVLSIKAMGQTITVDGELAETEVRGVTSVPMMLSMMAGQIGEMVQDSIARMLAKPVA
ncbi:polyhydroxyalkanoic acid system family protein [Pseudooceanicola sp. LIPI14-2-Ac024]|uniref:polyhydroxyalkanoic acid system family protein n=1 Tax=Pseudooceanicola sp. LIPI14-2-Ac024 TaxID=3344875 RepID=UPI0035CF2AEB